MARPEKGLEKWQLRRLEEEGIDTWKDAADARAQLSAALKSKAKEKEKSGGFGAIDAKATEVVPAKDTKTEKPDKPAKTEPAVQKVEVLPATQTVDVTAPIINVHVPAPSVTVHADQFKWFPVAKATFNWVQAAVIGAALFAALSSRLGDALITLTMK